MKIKILNNLSKINQIRKTYEICKASFSNRNINAKKKSLFYINLPNDTFLLINQTGHNVILNVNNNKINLSSSDNMIISKHVPTELYTTHIKLNSKINKFEIISNLQNDKIAEIPRHISDNFFVNEYISIDDDNPYLYYIDKSDFVSMFDKDLRDVIRFDDFVNSINNTKLTNSGNIQSAIPISTLKSIITKKYMSDKNVLDEIKSQDIADKRIKLITLINHCADNGSVDILNKLINVIGENDK